MIGKVLWDEFFTNRDWPAASAVAVAMLVVALAVPLLAAQRLLPGRPGTAQGEAEPQRTAFCAGALLFGFVFLYAPIVLLVVYSFNASRLVTVWAGFSTHWYGELAGNEGFDRLRRQASKSR